MPSDEEEDKRTQEQAKLRSAVDELSAIYENAPGLILVMDFERRIRKLNSAAGPITEAEPSDLLGLRFGDALRCLNSLNDPRGCGYGEACGSCALRAVVDLAIDSKAPQTGVDLHLQVRRADGDMRLSLRFSSVPITIADEPLILVSIEDRTESEHLEMRLASVSRLESLGRVAGGVAHDFNNMLAVILAGAGEFRDTLKADDPLAEVAEDITVAARRAAALTRQLLAFSRKQLLEFARVDLEAVVEGLTPMLRQVLGEDMTLLSRCESDLEEVMADVSQLEQVLLNLVVNARDAMPEGGEIVIEVSKVRAEALQLLREPKGRAYVCVQVQDSGIGMDKETLSHLFEPFFTTKEQGTGTGLGLATVHGIVEQHGGEIVIESDPTAGSCFSVFLPCAPALSQAALLRTGAAHESASAEHPRVPDETEFSGDETILVVDDEAGIQRLSARVLGRRGYTVLVAGNLEEAVQEARRYAGKLALVVTDVILPGQSGREVALRLRETFPEIKVIYMSAFTDDVVLRKGIEEQTLHFLHKPFERLQLLRLVRAVLDGD